MVKGLRECRKILEKYGYKLMSVEHGTHIYLNCEPELRLMISRSASDGNWLRRFEADVRRAYEGRDLRTGEKLCPHAECKNMFLAYDGFEGNIMRCDTCHQSVWVEKEIKVEPKQTDEGLERRGSAAAQVRSASPRQEHP